MRRARNVALGVLWILLSSRPAPAADHADGPRASADPAADITDVFAWMSPDATRVNLVMDLVRNATSGSRFSDSVQYVFHTESSAAFGAAPAPTVDIICEFNPQQKIQCSAGHGRGRRVAGDASDLAGLRSSGGALRVFAGLREDPFFFNLSGFRATSRIVAGAAGALSFDAAGCPALDAATSAALVNQLRSAAGGGSVVDNFARFNVLAIVISVDKSILTEGGPILAVWGSTNRRGEDCGEDDAERGVCPVQIDRMGRAGVNTALTNPFFRESVPEEKQKHEAIQDDYNASADPTEWAGLFSTEIAANLAILDGLDTVCGNQLLAGPSPVAGRYGTLAGILADDRLYLNAASGGCSQYLAVEANAVGIANNDCGGRTPLEDTIDTTYSVLAVGALGGVTDGVPVDGDGTASLKDFPFLDRPN
ncbi:MAG TPA: DUF4331 family protein [Candidatus Polarisedimenticolia bacterium]|nr:DUF4331 family protein [Candidatus Polarisedimenticolia bacterium]